MKKAGKMMEYTVDDKELDAAAFIQFANRIWPGNYDENKKEATFVRLPERNELNADINEALIVEFYNK